MAKIGLEDRSKHRPSELSGGQQQRVAIGRALVSRPTIVFADEPTGNLDSKTSGEILELMRDSVDGYGQTTVMVTHDPRAATIADRILFLADGLIVRDLGPSSAREVIAVSEELRHDDRRLPQRTVGAQAPTLLTALAIVLGVSMISGTYVLTDTITAAFTNIIDHSFQNSDAVISGKVAFKNDTTATPPDTGISGLRAREGAATARCRNGFGEVGGEAQLIGRDGKVISTGGGGSIASSVDPPNDARFNPLKLAEGRWPVGGGQIAIDKHTADTKHYALGDTIGVATDQGARRFEISRQSRRTPRARRSAPPRSRSSTSPPRRSCSRRSASSTGSSSRRRTG